MKHFKITPQLRIRACDRILRRAYSNLHASLARKEEERGEYAIEFENYLQGRINYYEEYNVSSV